MNVINYAIIDAPMEKSGVHIIVAGVIDPMKLSQLYSLSVFAHEFFSGVGLLVGLSHETLDCNVDEWLLCDVPNEVMGNIAEAGELKIFDIESEITMTLYLQATTGIVMQKSDALQVAC